MHYTVFDFAGQLEYLTTHKMFLSDRYAMYIIAIDISLPLQVICMILHVSAKGVAATSQTVVTLATIAGGEYSSNYRQKLYNSYCRYKDR